MAHPFPMASVFTEGMRRDSDRTMLPGGSVWNLVDFIPDEIQAAASGRGGWSAFGNALTGSPTTIPLIGYHPDLGLLVATDGTNLWNVSTGNIFSGSGSGVKFGTSGPAAYHRGYLFFGAGGTGDLPTSSYALTDSSTIIQFTSAPTGRLTGVYKDHALLAAEKSGGRITNPSANRIWFSAAGDPTTWDTNYGWWDTTGPITAIAPLTNAILIFHDGSTERLRGTTPPPGSDMVLEPLLPDVGCIDPFSVAYWQQNAIWASAQGIYMSNGASSVDLTAQAQMKTYWQSLMSAYTSSWRIAAGIYRDHYIISLNNGSTLVDCLCVSLLNNTMWRFTNIHGNTFAHVTSGIQEKLYMGTASGGIGELSTMWSPSASVKRDFDGTVPTPIIETGSFRGYDRLHRRWIQSMGKQKWRFAYMDYDLRDAASDNPTITLSYATTPGGSYTNVTGGTLPETTDYTRKRRGIGKTLGGAARSNMLEFKVAVTGPYASCNLYTLEADFGPIDIGRL